MSTAKQHREPLLHIAKRESMANGKAWLIRVAAIVIAMLLCGVLSSLLTGAGFFHLGF